MSGAYTLSVSLSNSESMKRLSEIIKENTPLPQDDDDPIINSKMSMKGRHSVTFTLDVKPDDEKGETELTKVTKTIVNAAKEEKLKFSCDPKVE